ncbi:TetR/AcrR family transcriptional regulator [Neisseriaceae bacterium CLB008]|nr:TetR/AcrR family transcriptional regulator [Neisseriaceae bacterium]
MPQTNAQVAPKRPRTKPAHVRLEELMNAAENLFLAQGVDATTIDDIVTAADVAKGTFYHYFSSKNDLLVSLGQRYTERFIERLAAAMAQCDDDDWVGKLRQWVHSNVTTYAETYHIHDIVYINHHHHDRANPAKNAILDQLLAIIEGGSQAGAWAPPQPRLVALMIYSGVHGATDDLIATQDADADAFADSLAQSCLRMLLP